MKTLLSKLRAFWDWVEAWFAPARDAHLYSEGREDEMKKPEEEMMKGRSRSEG